MIKIKKYVGDKTYMFPNGTLATPEIVYSKFPACKSFSHIFETDELEEVIFSMENLSAVRSRYSIAPSLTEDEAILEIERLRNIQPEPNIEPTPEERTANALEAMADGQSTENKAAIDALLTGEEM